MHSAEQPGAAVCDTRPLQEEEGATAAEVCDAMAVPLNVCHACPVRHCLTQASNAVASWPSQSQWCNAAGSDKQPLPFIIAATVVRV